MQMSQINSHNIKTSRLAVFHNCNTKTAYEKFRVNSQFPDFYRINKFPEIYRFPQLPSVLWHCWMGGRNGIRPVKNMAGWWRWALVRPNGVAPSQTISVSASVNLSLHHKVQKFSSGTGSPGWSRKKGCKMVVCVRRFHSCKHPAASDKITISVFQVNLGPPVPIGLSSSICSIRDSLTISDRGFLRARCLPLTQQTVSKHLENVSRWRIRQTVLALDTNFTTNYNRNIY